MDIQSAFSSGVQGLKAADERYAQAAQDIAEQTISTQNAKPQEQVAAPQDQINSDNLTEAAVNLKVAEFQSSTSAQVVKSADESLGTLLDVRV